MLSPEQHEARRGKLLTSSQIAAVVGLDYRSAASVWLYHQGVPDDGGSDHTVAGSRLERPIFEWAADTELDVLGWAPGCGVVQSEAEPWMGATPDFLVTPARDQAVIVPAEIKNTARASGVYPTGVEWSWGPAWSSEIPPHVLVQVAWQMAVLGSPWAYVAVLIAGWDLRCYRVDRDLELEADLVEAGRTFWFEHVIPGIEPPIGVHPDFERLVRRWDPDEDKALAMDDDLATLAESGVVARERVKAWSSRVDELDLAIKARMREAVVAEGATHRVTWKPTKDGKRPLRVARRK